MKIRKAEKRISQEFLNCWDRYCRSMQRSARIFLYQDDQYTLCELTELLKQEDKPVYVSVDEDDLCMGLPSVSSGNSPFHQHGVL